jgi:plastocyanin domain-containing protein
MTRKNLTVLFVLFVALALAAGCSKGDDKKKDDEAQKGDMKKGDMKKGDHAGAKARMVDIEVDGKGFHPGTINAKAGDHLELVFTRTSDQGCGTEVVLASTGKQYDLPLNEPVKVAFHAEKAGTVGFACGMDMLKGSIVVE